MSDSKLYTKTCKRCGASFATEKKYKQLCGNCLTDANYLRKPQNEPVKIEKFHRVQPDSVPIRAYVAEIEKYNREHGTSYTYGQFESLVHNGKIKL